MKRQPGGPADAQPEADAVERANTKWTPVRAEHELSSNVDPATWHGFLHRAIDDPKRFLRLCVLLVVVAVVLIALGLIAPEALALIAQLVGK